MAVRTANANWNGTLKEGKGNMHSETGTVDGNFGFSSRFQEGKGTNPEELLASAHAGCFSMALSAELGSAGYTPENISTEDKIHLDEDDGGFVISKIEIITKAKVPGIDEATFQKIAESTKTNCPVSKALQGVDFTLNATLEN